MINSNYRVTVELGGNSNSISVKSTSISKQEIVGTSFLSGPSGKSAYQVWLSLGNTGTEADYLLSLKGAPGDPASNLVTSVAGKQGVVTLTKSDVGLSNVPNTDFTSAVAANTAKNSYPSVDAAKLAGIQPGATANDTDANLKNRANHTGLQAVSTVTGLQTALDTKVQIGGDIGGTITTPKVKSRTVITVGASDADYITDGTADDVQIAQAYDLLNASGGGRIVLKKGTYNVASSAIIYTRSNITIEAESPGSVTISMGANSYFRAQAVSEVNFKGIKFVTTNFPAIRFVSGSYFTIDRCHFTGTGDSVSGILSFWGNFGVSSDISHVTVKNSKFKNITGTQRVIHVYPNNSHKYSDFTFHKNEFDAVSGAAIGLDVYYYLYNTWVTENTFKDLASGGHFYDSGVAVLTTVSASEFYVDGLFIDNNRYDNSLDQTALGAGFGQGFVWYYSAKNISITNNKVFGNWTVANDASGVSQGPALAPGRTDNPSENVVISGNHFEGFDSPMDPDSQRFVDISNNTVVNCGRTWGFGYLIQEYISIHDNISYNLGYVDEQEYGALVRTSNSNHKKNVYENNIVYYDGAGIDSVIIATGHAFDHSDIIFRNNTFFVPNSTVSSLSRKEFVDSVDIDLKRTSGNQIIGTAVYSDLNNFLSDITVPDEAYGAGWDGSLEVPTKNAVYDKVQSLIVSPGTTDQYRRGDNTWQILNQDAVPDGTTNKAYTAADKTRLSTTTGTNTGDQTIPTSLPPSGAAGGDLAGSYPNPTLAAAGTAGTYGTASQVPVLTTDSKGRVLSVVDTPVQITESQVTNLVTDLLAKANDANVLHTTGAETAAGKKTFTDSVATPSISDASGLLQLVLNAVASAVNYFSITNSAAGGDLSLSAEGSDTNISIALRAKGNGQVYVRPGTNGTAVFGIRNAANNFTVMQVDSSNNRMGIAAGTPNSTLQVGGSFASATTTVTTATTLNATHSTLRSNLSTALTHTLPTAIGITGRIYTIKNINTGVVTIATTSSQTIDGATTYALSAQYKYVTVQSNGASWDIVGNN